MAAGLFQPSAPVGTICHVHPAAIAHSIAAGQPAMAGR
jgi:hypothetical protein